MYFSRMDMDRILMNDPLLNSSERIIKTKLVNYICMYAVECESAADTQIFWNRMVDITEGLERDYQYEGRFDRNYKNEVDRGVRELRDGVEDLLRFRRNIPRRLFAWIEHMSRALAMDMWSTMRDLGYWIEAIHDCDPDAILDPPYF